MSVSKPWKDQERRHAKRMPQGERIWRQDFSEVAPDGENPTDIWDSKRLARLKGFVELFYECEKKYRSFGQGRRFHMVINYSESRRRDLVVVDAEHYAQLVREAENLDP